MLKLTRNPRSASEVLSLTAHRLIRWGTSEREAYALAQVVNLEQDAPDAVVEQAVIEALVSVKRAVNGLADIEYVAGDAVPHCDLKRPRMNSPPSQTSQSRDRCSTLG